MKFQKEVKILKAGMGIEVEPKKVHQMRNVSDKDVEFIVISTPKSHGERTS